MDPSQLVVIAIVATVGIIIVQALMRSAGRLLRWLVSVGGVAACVFLLWRGGALDWVEGFVAGLGV